MHRLWRWLQVICPAYSSLFAAVSRLCQSVNTAVIPDWPATDPADDTAMDYGRSSWSEAPAAAVAGGAAAQPGSPATPPAAAAAAASNVPDGERHPLSPAGSAGARGPRTPCGLEPVLEDRTLIADLPADLVSCMFSRCSDVCLQMQPAPRLALVPWLAPAPCFNAARAATCSYIDNLKQTLPECVRR